MPDSARALLRLRPAKTVEVFGRIVIRAKILAKMVQTLNCPRSPYIDELNPGAL